jgi:hypothetical protein
VVSGGVPEGGDQRCDQWESNPHRRGQGRWNYITSDT